MSTPFFESFESRRMFSVTMASANPPESVVAVGVYMPRVPMQDADPGSSQVDCSEGVPTTNPGLPRVTATQGLDSGSLVT